MQEIGSPAIRTMFDVHNAVDETRAARRTGGPLFRLSFATCTSTNSMAAIAARATTITSRSSKCCSRRGYTRLDFARSFRFLARARNAWPTNPCAISESRSPTAIMSHYVVTGGAGFIGSAIVRSLLDEGARKIVVIDNLLTGRERNLEEVRASIDFQRADIRNYEEIAPLIRGAGVVFHEAAIPSVPRSIDDPVPSHDVNIDGTFNVLRAAQAKGRPGGWSMPPRRSAYGDTEVLPKVESMSPAAEIALCAAETGGRILRNVFTGVYGLETVSLRYFNVYGPRQDPSSAYSGVLSLFMKSRSWTDTSDHLRRRRAVARLHLRRRRGGTQSESGARPGRLRQHVQRRQWRPDHAQPGVGAGAEAGRRAIHRANLRTAARRATCAIPRRTPRSRSAIWALTQGSLLKRACGGRSNGIAPAQKRDRKGARGPLPVTYCFLTGVSFNLSSGISVESNVMLDSVPNLR